MGTEGFYGLLESRDKRRFTVYVKRIFSQLDIGAMFHGVLFAYQKTLASLAKEDEIKMLTEITLPIVEETISKAFPELAKHETPDEVFRWFADLLKASTLVRKISITKEGDKYVLDIDGCAFGDHVHSKLEPKDVTCPWAIIAVAMAKKTCEREVRIEYSDFTPSGAITLIEFV